MEKDGLDRRLIGIVLGLRTSVPDALGSDRCCTEVFLLLSLKNVTVEGIRCCKKVRE